MKNSNDETRSAARKPVVDPCTTRSAIKVSTPWAEFEQAGPVQLEAEPRDEVQALRPNKLAAWRTVDDPMTGVWLPPRAGPDSIPGPPGWSAKPHSPGSTRPIELD